MATKDPFAEFAVPAAPEPERDPFAEFEAPKQEDAFAEFAVPEEEQKPAIYTPTEQYPGEHEHLKSINAVSGREIREIAAKNGVSSEDLRSIAPYWRVGVEEQAGQGTPMTDDMKKFAGYLGAAALDLPQFIAKKAQDPGMRAAIDDLQALAARRRTGLQTAGEISAGLVPALLTGGGSAAAEAGATGLTALSGAKMLGKEVLKQGAIGAGFGAVSGLAKSREGEELEEIGKEAAGGFILGAGLGAGLGVLKIGGAVRRALGAGTAEAENLVAKVEAEVAKPEVGEAIERGAKRVSQIAEGEAPSVSIELDRPLVARELEKLNKEPEFLQKLKEANPDLVEYAAKEGADEARLSELLAKRNVANREASETIQFSQWLKTQQLPPIRKASEIAEAIEAPTLSKAGRFIENWTRTGGRSAEFLQQEFRNWKVAQIAQDLNSERLIRGLGVTSSELTRQVRKFFRVRGQFKIIDNRNGGLTNLEGLGDRLVEADNLKNKHLNKVLEEARKTLDEATGSGIRQDLKAAQLEELERTGNTAWSTPEQAQVFGKFQDLFQKARQAANDLGVKIQEISAEKAKVYIPRMQVDAETTTGRIRARVQEIEQASGVSFKTFFTDAQMAEMQKSAPKAFEELKQGLEYLSGRRIARADQLSRYATEAVTVDGTARLTSSRLARKGASAAMSRQEAGIPGFLRETDLNKLYVRWNADVLKQAYLRDSLQELTKQRNLLAAAGDRAGVEYTDWYLKKLAGGEQGMARWASNLKSQFVSSMTQKAEAARAAGQNKTARIYESLSENSDFMNLVSGSMYGNLLGLNPKSAVYNLIQPFVTMLPELTLGGNGWAAGKTLKGYFAAMNSVRDPKRARELLSPFMSPHLSDEIVGSFRTGMEHGSGGKLARKALDKYTQGALAFMQSSETLNRLVTLHVAEDVAKDLFFKNTSALKFLDGMGAGYKRQVERLIQEGNREGLTRTLQSYMVGKTMFHYSPLMTSQLGSYLGKLGTAFSTWPTTITADIVGDFAGKGAAGGSYLFFKKYMAPLAVLSFLDNWMEANGVGPDQAPETRALLGRQGFKGAAPVKTIGDIGQRGIVSSPYVDESFKAFAAAVSGDPEGWWRSTKAMGKVFVPGHSLKQLIYTTIPRMRGQEPERD